MGSSQSFKFIKWLAACILILAIANIATIKVTVETHLWLSGSAFLLAVIGITSNDKKLLHLLVLITGAFISIRYIWWRYSETLPWESTLDLPFAIALLVTECYGITIYFLGMFVNVRQRSRDITPINVNQAIPTIDVFIPTYNESIRVVAPTVSAAMQLQYPGKVNVWVLDDGGTPEKLNNEDPQQARIAQQRTHKLKDLCQKLGANYITRPANVHAKAGNINHALEHSNGELILILDADHVPTKDFLINTVGMFQQQPKLGFIQTPHFFATPGPIEKNLGIEDKVPSENEMFYNRILSGMDFWNASFFCGSAAIIRREALLDVGGISTRTITEDADTALEIHAKGWDSAYLNRAMIAGLSPDTFGAYVTQRSRWAQGMLQIFLLNNPLLKHGLSFPQKICYLNSTLFWFFPLFRVMYLIAPLCYLVFDLQIFVGNANDFLVFAIPHLAISMVISQHLFGKTRNALFSEFYETVLSLYLFFPALSVLINPKKPSFTVTPKGETTSHVHFSPLTPVIVGLFVVIAAAEAWGLYRIYNYPIEQGQLAVVLVFNTLNMLLCAASLGATLEKVQRRSEPRSHCNISTFVTTENQTIKAKIEDASLHGARLSINSMKGTFKPDQVFDLKCYITKHDASNNCKPKLKPHSVAMKVLHCQVKGTGQMVSCEILETNTQTLEIFTNMVFSHSERWQQRRQFETKQSKGIITALLGFFQLAISSFTTSAKTAYTLKKRSKEAIKDSAAQDISQ
ncbi:UDP-forming cellulose synthase catalytic subunit [Photobacterium indicum]|uniref:UDP-forming cellulose synthase catalytic subunit n=1 Tax=Photobacterium indicum TaxID=81447 RepID=UPI003D0A59C7